MECINIPVVPNLISCVIMSNVAIFLIKAVVVLVKFYTCFHQKD